MAFCCWFNSTKKYAYQVGSCCSGWKVKRVIVKECMLCGNKTIKEPGFGSREEETHYCDTQQEVVIISRVNGIPLLSELE